MKEYLSLNMLNWNNQISFKQNAIKIIKGYLPFEVNFLSQKTHVADAKELLNLLNCNPMSDMEVYLFVQAMRQDLMGETGEFKQRLDFMGTSMEMINPTLKGMGAIGQTIKSVFSFS